MTREGRDLRERLRASVEVIANEVLDRLRQAGHQPHEIAEPGNLARESLRYLYRILVLLHAEAAGGHSLARLREHVSRPPASSGPGGCQLYEELDRLFQLAGGGSELFPAGSPRLIGRVIPRPGGGPALDARLRDATLRQVLCPFLLGPGRFSVHQLGAAHEGLMAYRGVLLGEEPSRFVYRLAGRDRQSSASFYTPQSLTEVTVRLAIEHRLDRDGTTTPARELLGWTICEPALGSGTFLGEAINQVAAEYLRRRRQERGPGPEPERYDEELQRVKAHIARHNSYGVDLNATTVELAEVSLRLDVSSAGPHLRRGNSLIGAGRRVYCASQLADRSWLTTAPRDVPFRDGPIDADAVHHFLLPAEGWGAVAGEKEARRWAPAETERLRRWRATMKRAPTAGQTGRLQTLAVRVEQLWEQRAVASWRLGTLMDVWCALWSWPLDQVGLLDNPDPGGLNSLDAWLSFAEALLGTDAPRALAERFPWLATAEAIAERQGFFHWELAFAPVFADGGFDLVVGNPPWLRPEWRENDVLAEADPWFALDDRPDPETSRRRKAELFEDDSFRHEFLGRFAEHAGLVSFLSSPTTYELLAGTQPDLYRGFLCQTWRILGPAGIAGLIHPGTHFHGAREASLRAEVYRRLRLHAHFHNRRGIFPDVHANTEFAVQVYGAAQTIGFTHVSWLFDPSTLTGSLRHDGTGEVPGIKRKGTWDVEPHAARILRVDESLLARWSRLVGDDEREPSRARLLFPVTSVEQNAMDVLARFPDRLRDRRPRSSFGLHEGTAQKSGLIRWQTGERTAWDEVVLQGPHFGIATPVSKQPRIPCRSNRDWDAVDLDHLPEDFVPRSNYERGAGRDLFQAAMQHTDLHRVAWREMVAFDTERSLYSCLLPPGPAHIDAVNTLALATPWETCLVAGFWSSLPIDYILRIWGKRHVRISQAQNLPTPRPDHPLAPALALRTLRLNCVTNAHAALWTELHPLATTGDDNWTTDRPGVPDLRAAGPAWHPGVALRSEAARRAALVEIDALVAVWLGLTCDELLSLYRSRFPILSDYEATTWHDAAGRRIARSHHAFGHTQSKTDHSHLSAHLSDPTHHPAPTGYTPPFHKADRDAEYRRAHEAFTTRMCQSSPPTKPQTP